MSFQSFLSEFIKDKELEEPSIDSTINEEMMDFTINEELFDLNEEMMEFAINEQEGETRNELEYLLNNDIESSTSTNYNHDSINSIHDNNGNTNSIHFNDSIHGIISDNGIVNSINTKIDNNINNTINNTNTSLSNSINRILDNTINRSNSILENTINSINYDNANQQVFDTNSNRIVNGIETNRIVNENDSSLLKTIEILNTLISTEREKHSIEIYNLKQQYLEEKEGILLDLKARIQTNELTLQEIATLLNCNQLNIKQTIQSLLNNQSVEYEKSLSKIIQKYNSNFNNYQQNQILLLQRVKDKYIKVLKEMRLELELARKRIYNEMKQEWKKKKNSFKAVCFEISKECSCFLKLKKALE
jgi:hypothetical protein